MTNAKIQRTLNELQDIIKTIKAKADAGASWTNSEERTNIEKRLDHCLDKTNPRHTNLNTDLEIDLKEIEDDKDKEQLEKDKKDLEKQIQEKGELWAKLTPELLTSLASFRKVKKNTDGTDQKDAQGNPVYEELIDTTKIEAIKTVIDELKDKGVKADLTETNTKIDDFKKDLDKKSEAVNKTTDNTAKYAGISACILGVISVVLLGYLAFFKNKKSEDHDN